MIRQLSDQDIDSVLNVWLESRLVNGGTDSFIGMTVLSWPVSVLSKVQPLLKPITFRCLLEACCAIA